MAKTLLLDTVLWDLVIDARNNIAVATDPYALAQDTASAIRLFQGTLYYDTSKGVPYWSDVLGKATPVSLLKVLFENAAKTVAGVASARCIITSVTGRTASGFVEVTGDNGQTSTAAF